MINHLENPQLEYNKCFSPLNHKTTLPNYNKKAGHLLWNYTTDCAALSERKA